ncbi:MAG TPA: cupin domain-containing protein [Longimicrobiales bacterium]|nr:cupin domain-containing protein [Longimicrobiales bacterium]
MAETARNYDISTDEILFPHGEKFNVMEVANAQQPWWNRTLCAVNDSVVRLGVLEGDFHWHKHDNEDELFLVMEGQLDIELEDRMVSLKAGEAVVISA